ncbi:MmgE/PrpD family protein [Methylobacterium oryzihabitans]|nr:MmgE/PrpD family protein [Methylobacterium oryzihabitans]
MASRDTMAEPPVRLARALVRQARAARLADLPVPAVDRLKIGLLDFLSCAFEARDLPTSRQAAAIATTVEGGATILGTAKAAPAGEAAFANATAGHGLVREDMHAASIGHHGVVLWPLLLALAERERVAGDRLLLAAALGYEAGGRIGRALFTADLARLFRPTGLLGPLGGAVAGGVLLGLSEDEAVSALALAANASCGLNQWPGEGGSDMYFHPGVAARGAIAAVDLARAGAFGSEAILDGEAGLFAAFARRAAPDAIRLFPDGEAEILAVYNKPVPACNFAQTACQAAIAVAREVGPAETIEAVTVHLPEAAIRYPGCDAAGPFVRALQAKMSIPYGVAAALARGRIDEAAYARLDDPAVTRILPLVRLVRDPGFTRDFPARQGAEVEVALSSGARISRRLADVVPATEGEIRARFRQAADAVLPAGRADAIEEAVDRLEAAADAGAVAALCAADAARPRLAAGRRAPRG